MHDVARPGLYDELVKRGLLERGAAIALGAGSDPEKAEALDLLLAESGSNFRASPRAAFILRHKLEEKGDQVENGTNQPPSQDAARAAPPAGGEIDSKAAPRTRGAPKGNKNAVGNRGGPGAPPGHDRATKHGAYRNPFLHGLDKEDAEAIGEMAELDPIKLQRKSIEGWLQLIAEMTVEIGAIRASPNRMWMLGTTYRRQEGDGELMGTGRISERKRVPREEALRIMVEARAKVQARLDKAIATLATLMRNTKDTPPGSGAPADIDYSKLTVEELRDLERLLAKAAQP